MIDRRIRRVIEDGVVELAENSPDGFHVARLQTYIVKRGLRTYMPSTNQIAHFLAAYANRLGVVRIGEGRWRVENTRCQPNASQRSDETQTRIASHGAGGVRA